MSNFRNFSIVASFLGLWINSFFSDKIQIMIGFTLIFTFGILHGANDLVLIEKSQGSNHRFNFKKMILFYSIVVILGSLLFYFIPVFALFLFIVFSGYHFGEQHWIGIIKTNRSFSSALFFLNYGILILFLLFIFHTDEVSKIIYEITTLSISNDMIQTSFKIILAGFLLQVIFRILKTKSIHEIIFKELFLLIVFAVLFKTSSLIWGFALYFILWHSIPSMQDQITYIYESATFENFVKYFKSAFAYWIMALFGVFGLYYLLYDAHIFNALFFSFLAAITFPHVCVIIIMFQKKQGTSEVYSKPE
jgi:Brp/Blh family beta-carotene 15,15'-monooxygenase